MAFLPRNVTFSLDGWEGLLPLSSSNWLFIVRGGWGAVCAFWRTGSSAHHILADRKLQTEDICEVQGMLENVTCRIDQCPERCLSILGD